MTTSTLTVTDFVLARIAEDEATASLFAAAEQPKWQLTVWPHDGEPIPLEARAFSAARVLAQCVAMRKIVYEARDYSPELAEGDNGEWALGMAVCALASIWPSHPDWREEWA